jgi:hypothetical protein
VAQEGTESELIYLWNRFQADAAAQLYAATGKRTPIVLWTSRLTEKVPGDNAVFTNTFSEIRRILHCVALIIVFN